MSSADQDGLQAQGEEGSRDYASLREIVARSPSPSQRTFRVAPIVARPPIPTPRPAPVTSIVTKPLEPKPRWLERESNRRRLRIAAIALLLAVVAAIPYPLYVTEPCVVLPIARHDVRAEIEGVIKEILVDEGAFVHAGDLVARLDEREIDGALHQAKADVEARRATLAKMHNGSRVEEIARAQSVVASRLHDLQFARTEANRAKALLGSGLTSVQGYESQVRQLRLAETSAAQAQAELSLVRAGFRVEEVSFAEAELHRAEVAVEYLEKKRRYLTIVAPIDGVVTTPKFREHLHAKVDAGGIVCEIVDMRRTRTEILVPEREVDIVAIGQKTAMKVQSFPLHEFNGAVTFIAEAVETQGDARHVRVVTEIDNTGGLLRERMTGYGEIYTGRTPLAVLGLRRMVRWIRVRFLI